MDDLNTEIQVVRSQLDATRSNLNVQNKSVLTQIDGMQYQIASLENAIEKSLIHSPINGVVLKNTSIDMNSFLPDTLFLK